MAKRCSVFDVADYFLCLQDPEAGDYISNLKLQKLCYYAQGFHLAMNNSRLFENDIEAWQHGPVVRDLYYKYKDCGAGILKVSEDFSPKILSETIKELLENIYKIYGQYSAWRLRDMTHQEPPWINAINKKQEIISDQELIGFFKTGLV
ncbi:MAG: DUF4065 domain-containing protein [Holosporaceae bacterium]|jgi:uncharacterized phage-associated protein|nr:DUF4065 domain-containing protein [Holosporaceae bacterium]